MAKNSFGEVEIFYPPNGMQIQWDRLIEFDLIFMHRPTQEKDLILLRMARLLNIPVWTDYDDWLFRLPDWNPHKDVYHRADVQNVIATMLACSDIVSVSTQALYDQFSKVNDNVHIIPNAYRSDLFPWRQTSSVENMPKRNEIYVWRGSNTHDGDLLSVADAFMNLTKPVHFMGSMSYSISSQMAGNAVSIPAVDPIMYWKSIYRMAPKVWLFPLKDDFFNECKSNIAWIESIHAGAICIAPTEMKEWHCPGVIGYDVDNPESFFEAAEYAMYMNEKEFNAHLEAGWTHIQHLYDIKIINISRHSIFNSIFLSSFMRNKRDVNSPLIGQWALGILKNEIKI